MKKTQHEPIELTRLFVVYFPEISDHWVSEQFQGLSLAHIKSMHKVRDVRILAPKICLSEAAISFLALSMTFGALNIF